MKAAPDIPTAIEAGLPGMMAANFNGLFARVGTPKPMLDRITQLTRAALAEDEVQKSLITSGFEPIINSGPEEASSMVTDELARWVPIVRRPASGWSESDQLAMYMFTSVSHHFQSEYFSRYDAASL